MGRAPEVGEGGDKGERIGGLHQHERHGGTEKDNVGAVVLGEKFTFEVSAGGRSLAGEETGNGTSILLFPEGYTLTG